MDGQALRSSPWYFSLRPDNAFWRSPADSKSCGHRSSTASMHFSIIALSYLASAVRQCRAASYCSQVRHQVTSYGRSQVASPQSTSSLWRQHRWGATFGYVTSPHHVTSWIFIISSPEESTPTAIDNISWIFFSFKLWIFWELFVYCDKSRHLFR